MSLLAPLADFGDVMNNHIILIDANVYLRFYDSSGDRFRLLLKTLVELKENIFITEQICSEVDRNKLSVAMNSFLTNYKSLGIEKTTLPEHLDNNADEKLKRWNDSRNNLLQKEEKLKKEYSQIVSSTLQSIMTSDDNVSKSLSTIFSSSQQASTAEISAARLRKELGNPPGKSGDPLGDQLTWEQFLSKYSAQEVWIITADRDYLTKYTGNYYLNPYLYNELKIKSRDTSPKIHLFESLTDGINHYRKNIGKKINTFPSNIDLGEIRHEEEKIIKNIVSSSNINSIAYDEKTLRLEIEFLNGAKYQYFDVPKTIYCELMAAASHGYYFASNIKGSYSYSKV